MKIEEFKNLHKGERAFVICNGPSLNKHNLELLKDEITFGGNRIYLHDTFTPKYYSMEDWGAICQYYNEVNNRVESDYKFIAERFSSDFIYGKDVVYISFERWKEGTNYIADIIDKDEGTFYWGSTITFLLVQLAYYMGCSPIYIIGADHLKENTSEPLTHFTDEYVKNREYNATSIDIINIGYRLLNDRIPNIYNATIGGDLEIFDRVDYDGLFTT